MHQDSLEKLDIEYQNYLRRNSDQLLKEALLQKKPELDKYKKVVKLYGHPLSPNIQTLTPSLPQDFDLGDAAINNNNTPKNQSVNKILETRHNAHIENKVLNLFVILFTILILFQFSLISILKFDINWPTFDLIDYSLVFNYAYLIILLLGKSITYLFLSVFFIRLYIGLKVFGSSVNTNILLKLINVQFMGFLSSSMMAIGIMSLDFLFKLLLKRLELISDDVSDEDRDNEQVGKFNLLLDNIQGWFYVFDVVLYSTIFIGLVLSGLRKVVRFAISRRSVSLE